jgi:phospholipid/cholesterol/gamma-HCH transport system substrate-binding protein
MRSTTMETNVNYTLVGAFVIFLVGAFIMSIIWLSAGISVDKYLMYKVYMKESVSGLSPDAQVEYNGVNVGAVKRIDLNSKNPHLVTLLLKIKIGTPITVGTRATLNVKGLTGVAYLALQDDGNDLRPLQASPDEVYPVIATSPSLFLRLDTALTKLTDSLHNVSNSVQILLDEENLDSIKHTLISLRELSGALAGHRTDYGTIIQNMAAASRHFAPMTRNGEDAAELLSTQTLPAANQALSNLSVITSDIKQNPAVLLRGKGEPLLGPGEE